METTRNFGILVAMLAIGLISSGVALGQEVQRDQEPVRKASRHTYRSLSAGPVAQLATLQQDVAPSRVVKAQPLIGNAAKVNQLSTSKTRQLSASGVANVAAPIAPVAQVAQPLVVNPVTHSTHAQVVTNPYANTAQPKVYTSTTYTNYGHPSSYTVQTSYAQPVVYSSSFCSTPVYSSYRPTYYCAPTTYRYPRHHYSNTRYSYRRPSYHSGYRIGYSSHYGHRSSYSSGHIGYRGSKINIGFSFGRGYSGCR